MKTKKIAVFLLFSFMILSCSKESTNEKNNEESKSTSIADEEIADPASLISLDKAKEQLDNYNEAHPLEVGSEYALRTWISIEELKAYIAYIEKESQKKGIVVSGVDFIHTQYKEAAPGSPNPDNTVYDKTLMLAPTYKSGTANIAFDPIYSEQGKPKNLSNLFDEIDSDSLNGKNTAGPGGSSIANGLRSCPNHCN